MIGEKYRKVFKTIKSCETMEQLKNAVNLANNYFKSNNIKKSDPEYVSLSSALNIASGKCKDMNEEYFASTQDFKNAAATSGVDALKSIAFEQEEIEGGLADGKSVEDIADEHSVNIKDIVAQIKKGKKVEMEHTNDPNVAIEIAKDHEMEHPFYYDALENMEKELAEGAKLMESFYKNKVDDRVEIIHALQHVIDTIKSIDNLEQKETAQEYINIFKKRYNKLEQIDTLVSSLQSQLDGVLSEEVEEIDEATSAGSGGAYVGALGRKPIKRTVYKTDVPVANAGGMATPIGKLYSFKKSQLKE